MMFNFSFFLILQILVQIKNRTNDRIKDAQNLEENAKSSSSPIQNILEPSKNHGPSTSHVPFPGPINPLPLKTWKKTAVNFR